MSNYGIKFTFDDGVVDKNATIGFDENLETIFLSSSILDKNEMPMFWFGTKHRQATDLEAMIEGFASAGFIIDFYDPSERLLLETEVQEHFGFV